MLRKIIREVSICILIFFSSMIKLGGYNPIGIASACATISVGGNIPACIVSLILGMISVYDREVVIKYIGVILFFSLAEVIFRKVKFKIDEVSKSMVFMGVFFLVNLTIHYQDLTFVNVIIMLCEVIGSSCICMVMAVTLNFFREKSDAISDKTKRGINNRKHIKQKYRYSSFANNKIEEYAEVIRNMSRSINRPSFEDKSISIKRGNAVFEKISEKYCSNCDRCNICWEKEIKSTSRAADMIVEAGIKKGRVCLEDLPRNFMIRCKNINQFILDTNASLAIEKNNIRWLSIVGDIKKVMSEGLVELADSLCDFSRNYNNCIMLSSYKEKCIRIGLKKNDIFLKDIYYYRNKNGIREMGLSVRSLRGRIVKSGVIASVVSEIMDTQMEVSVFSRDNVSNSLCEIVLIEKTIYEIITSFKCLKKEGEILCGDNYAVFDSCCGKSVMVLSDGMGSGKEAFEESKKTIEMVEDFLTVGFSGEIALKLVNFAMYLNTFNSNMYATIDACIVDNYSGECIFIKNGAAPSFIKRGNKVRVISDRSFPIGVFSSPDYNEHKIELKDGDIIVMITDGFQECMSTGLDDIELIIDFLGDIKSNNPKVIATELMGKCTNSGLIKDDISVLVGIIWKNN